MNPPLDDATMARLSNIEAVAKALGAGPELTKALIAAAAAPGILALHWGRIVEDLKFGKDSPSCP